MCTLVFTGCQIKPWRMIRVSDKWDKTPESEVVILIKYCRWWNHLPVVLHSAYCSVTILAEAVMEFWMVHPVFTTLMLANWIFCRNQASETWRLKGRHVKDVNYGGKKKGVPENWARESVNCASVICDMLEHLSVCHVPAWSQHIPPVVHDQDWSGAEDSSLSCGRLHLKCNVCWDGAPSRKWIMVLGDVQSEVLETFVLSTCKCSSHHLFPLVVIPFRQTMLTEYISLCIMHSVYPVLTLTTALPYFYCVGL